MKFRIVVTGDGKEEDVNKAAGEVREYLQASGLNVHAGTVQADGRPDNVFFRSGGSATGPSENRPAGSQAATDQQREQSQRVLEQSKNLAQGQQPQTGEQPPPEGQNTGQDQPPKA